MKHASTRALLRDSRRTATSSSRALEILQDANLTVRCFAVLQWNVEPVPRASLLTTPTDPLTPSACPQCATLADGTSPPLSMPTGCRASTRNWPTTRSHRQHHRRLRCRNVSRRCRLRCLRSRVLRSWHRPTSPRPLHRHRRHLPMII